MPRSFDVPSFYRSQGVLAVKQLRHKEDPKKRDLRPTVLDFGPVHFHLARHFGFCFGVENAIEIAYRVLREHPGRQIYLLSEMIHNQEVNADLLSRGVKFLMKTDGTRLLEFSTLNKDDIVIVPAFGTTIELQKELESYGVNPYLYDATCPFVEKVWKRADDLGKKGFSVIVHGKHYHEETRATFSHSQVTAPTLIVRDMVETKRVIEFIEGKISSEELLKEFKHAVSLGFNPDKDLNRIGVVNQTTMLASDTKEISTAFKQTMQRKWGDSKLKEHFADTRDTLCYATYENQSATKELTKSGADFALVVGGYNSSNTSHLVELLEEHMPTYYIKNCSEIESKTRINHYLLEKKELCTTQNWLPEIKDRPLKVAISAGASCPDSSVDAVIQKVASFFESSLNWEQVLSREYNLSS